MALFLGIKNLLRSTKEEVKVPEFDPHPLVRLSEELVTTDHVLRVCSRVCRGQQDTSPFHAGMDYEVAWCQIRYRSSDFVFGCVKTETLRQQSLRLVIRKQLKSVRESIINELKF